MAKLETVWQRCPKHPGARLKRSVMPYTDVMTWEHSMKVIVVCEECEEAVEKLKDLVGQK